MIKKDKFNLARGGWYRVLEISCEKCNTLVCKYQKDGPGNLRRMYLDRIIETKISLNKKELKCSNKHLLGMKIIYEKENRPAFRLFVDAVNKKIVKNK
jgi:hypothetical protein